MNMEVSLREQILDTSRRLLNEKGVSALSMRKIAGEIGVSATSIYLHFENKDHLMHTLIEEAVEELSHELEVNVKTVEGTLERFEKIIRCYVDFGLKNPEKYQVIYNVRSNAMARYPKEKFRKARRGYYLLVETIKKGVEENLMEVADPLIAAYSIWAQLHGVVSVVLNRRLDRQIDREKFIKESLEHIVQGFLIRNAVT